MATCVETMTCFPENIMETFRLYEYQTGVPLVTVLAFLVGIIIIAIYLHTRSLAHLAVMGIYALSIFGSMFIADTFLEEQYHTALYIVAVLIASVVVVFVLRLVKE